MSQTHAGIAACSFDDGSTGIGHQLSASSIIFIAIRSLMGFPGLKVFTFARTGAGMSLVILFNLTIGVLPMVSKILLQYMQQRYDSDTERCLLKIYTCSSASNKSSKSSFGSSMPIERQQDCLESMGCAFQGV